MKVVTLLAGFLLSIFATILGVGGKETNTIEQLKPLSVDLLMPPNERVYLYFQEFSEQYEVPMQYILRCAKLESSYRGLEHSNYAPFEDNLVSSAQAYSVLQVRVIAAREVWPEYNYIAKYKILQFELFSDRWMTEQKRQKEYREKYGLEPTTVLNYKTDNELAYLLRYNLKFNIESGIRYMRFLKNKGYTWAQTYSVYNQGWVGADSINSYARKIAKS